MAATNGSLERAVGELSGQVGQMMKHLDRQDAERNKNHEENSKRLDALTAIKPVVERNDLWIENTGKKLVPRVEVIEGTIIRLRSGSRGLLLGIGLGGAGIGTGLTLLLSKAGVFLHGMFP